MLIGMPYPAYDPKSMWRPRVRPMDEMRAAESGATGRPSIRVFQTFVASKTGQSGAPGSVGATPAAGAGDTGVPTGVGDGVGVGLGLGWLVADRGSVPARYSAPSDQ